jgi:hypothetical protein
MEENNSVGTVQNVRMGFIEQLQDVEELESKEAPCGADGGIHPFGWCHNHNETLLKHV